MMRMKLKKYIALLLAIILLAAPLAGCGTSALPEESAELTSAVYEAVPQSLAEVVSLQGVSPPAAIWDIFPDEEVAREVASSFGRQTGVTKTMDSIVTQADLDQIRWFSFGISSSPIESLEGIQYLRELTSLNVQRHQISDLSLLSGLVNLRELHLSGNQINDISPLSGLVSLERLSLGVNQISDLSPLSALNNLGFLQLTDNQIVDFSPIPDLIPLHFPIGFHRVSILVGRGQEVTLEPMSQASIISIANPVRDQHGDSIPLSYISDGGVYENGTITWSGLTIQNSLSFSWQHYLFSSCSDSRSDWIDETSGTVTIPLIPDPATARTVIFQHNGTDTPQFPFAPATVFTLITVFPNFPIDWNQSPEAQKIYNTGHILSTGSPGTAVVPGDLVQGRAFWGWFRSEELVRSIGGFPESRPPLGATGEDLSTLTFTESELDEGVTLVAVWSIWGDVDDDGMVMASDVLLLNQWLIDRTAEAADIPAHFNLPINLHAADVNVDGRIDANDILLLNQYLVDRSPTGFAPRFFAVLGRPAS